MGLLEQEISELRTLLKLIEKGKVTEGQVLARVAVYSQIEKRAKLMLNAFSMVVKNGRTLNRIIKSNLIGDLEAVDTIPDVNGQKIICILGEDKIITRQECLDLSGQKDNYEVCQECEHSRVTKGLLLDE